MSVGTSSTSDACHQIRDYLQGVDEETFMATSMLHDVVIRQISPETRANILIIPGEDHWDDESTCHSSLLPLS